MGIYRIKPTFQRILQPLIDRLIAARVAPDWMTGAAIGVAGAMAVALLAAPINSAWLWIVVAGACLRLTLNALDGQVARALGYAGPWGEVKNELGDRIADALIFGALAMLSTVSSLWGIAALCATLLTGFVGVLGKAVTGQREYGGWMGKPDRMLSLAGVAAIVALTNNWRWFAFYLPLLTVLLIITIIQRLRLIHGRC